MKVKFKATEKIPEWKNRFGIWRDGHVRELPDDIAERLIKRFPRFFFQVKETSPSQDKMVRGITASKGKDEPDNT
jgi:hypothetical protein